MAVANKDRAPIRWVRIDTTEEKPKHTEITAATQSKLIAILTPILTIACT